MPNTPNTTNTELAVVSPGEQTPEVRLNNTPTVSNAAHQVTPETTTEPTHQVDQARAIMARSRREVRRRLF